MNAYEHLGKVLAVSPGMLEALDSSMSARTGKKGVMEKVDGDVQSLITRTLSTLNSNNHFAPHIRGVLRKTIVKHERQVMRFLEQIPGVDEFEKAAEFAGRIARVGKGFFLKKEYGKEILRKRRPEHLLQFLNLDSVDELFEQHDVTEAFSALRFMESDEWMHETFEEAYSSFTPDDFEEREIEIKVLGPEWGEVSKKFVEKKHHNVSHLKEFGVIFVNPVREDIPGKFLRDFALLLHYFHEIEFYSKLFRKYSGGDDFAGHLKSLLRGDVPEQTRVKEGEWLIVQRYLVKENPEDPRLFLPRVNPEAMHWSRGERDLTEFGAKHASVDLELWYDLDWVGCVCEGSGDVVSFDLEDNAMSLVSFMEGREEYFSYHQRESMWTRIFSEYVGGEEELEKLLLEHFGKAVIQF